MSNESKITCSCSNGTSLPLSSFYYCQRCSDLKCRFCVYETIQCYFCPSCEQNIPSGEAMDNENRCKKCFDCPECKTTLKMSARVINASGQSGNAALREKQPSTVVFFQCTFCHWTSLNSLTAASPEELLKAFAEKETSNEAAKTFEEFVECLKKEEHDAALKERKRRKRSLFRSMSSRENVSKTFVPGDSFENLATSLKAKEDQLTFAGRRKKLEEIAPPFPDLSTPAAEMNNIGELTSLSQRFSDFPISDCPQKKEMYPVRKLLSSKVGKSCSSCDKVLLKPGINPSQVQFDLRHVAFLFLPRFKLVPHLGAISNEWKKSSEEGHRILLSVQHLVQEFMYFRIEPIGDGSLGNAELKIEETEKEKENFQYILPYQFDPDVDIELQEQLEKLQSSQTDPNWITKREENTILISIPFVPTGSVGDSLELAFKVRAKFTLPTGKQETCFPVSFTLGTIVE